MRPEPRHTAPLGTARMAPRPAQIIPPDARARQANRVTTQAQNTHLLPRFVKGQIEVPDRPR